MGVLKNKTCWLLTFLIPAVAVIFLSPARKESQDISEQPANKAVIVKVINFRLEKEIAAQSSPPGKIFLVLETEWKNIHPRQKIEKSKLEKKPDRTMGVGRLLGGKKEEKEEYVEVDVAYLVPNFLDHAYILADGQSYSPDKLTETVAEGLGLNQALSLSRQGDVKKVRLVYAIPENSRDLAFQFFDYAYGHVLILIQGDLKLATGTGASAARALGEIKDSFLELQATAIDFQPRYKDEAAPEGWHYAVVRLRGKSLSASGGQKNIIQVEPQKYIWVATKEGYLYYSSGGTTTEENYIRFTPDFYQNQEVAFLVPAREKEISLGMRLQNRVYSLSLTAPPATSSLTNPLASHRDGNTMEVMLFGVRRAKDHILLDLGIKSLVKSGIEIQTDAQFILKAGGEDISFDEEATAALFHRPPTPFVIPPETLVRFELAFPGDRTPEILYYRGYESEKYFELNIKD